MLQEGGASLAGSPLTAILAQHTVHKVVEASIEGHSMDAATLAQQTLTILVPALPYLTYAAGAAMEAAASNVGEAGWDAAQRLWGWLKDKFVVQPDVQEAMAELTAKPEGDEARTVLAFKLRKLFEKDAALASQVAEFFRKEGVLQKINAERTRMTRVGQHAAGGGPSEQVIKATDSELTDVTQSVKR
jgi:hypothetical protein